MAKKADNSATKAARKKDPSSASGGGFLDTDHLRQLPYGNLALRHQAHRFLGYGVGVALSLLALFWLVAANWQAVSHLTGFLGKAEPHVVSYEVVTQVTQLSPPPALDTHESAGSSSSPKATTLPSSIGKVKPVNDDDAPAQQTIATQKELHAATQTQASSATYAGDGSGGSGDEVPMGVQYDTMPSVLEQKKPLYPETARVAGITGKIFVAVLIGEHGRPIKAMVMRRIPADCTVFDTVALKSVMESKYSPGIQNGKPVKVWLTVPIRFQID